VSPPPTRRNPLAASERSSTDRAAGGRAAGSRREARDLERIEQRRATADGPSGTRSSMPKSWTRSWVSSRSYAASPTTRPARRPPLARRRRGGHAGWPRGAARRTAGGGQRTTARRVRSHDADLQPASCTGGAARVASGCTDHPHATRVPTPCFGFRPKHAARGQSRVGGRWRAGEISAKPPISRHSSWDSR